MTGPVAVPKTPRRRRSSLKRTATVVVVMLSVVALLAVAFAVVHYFTSRTRFDDYDGGKYYIKQRDGVYVLLDENRTLVRMNDEGDYYITDYGTLLMIDPETGEYSVVASVIPADGEELEFHSYTGEFDVLIYPYLQRSEIQSIRVVNEKGDFTLYYDAETDDFKFLGYEDYAYDETMFSSLVVATGYASTYKRLNLATFDPSVDTTDEYGYDKYAGFRANGYAEYGLEEETNYFEITERKGDKPKTHKVIVGDPIPSGTGYYARYAGRNEVYILKETEDTSYSYALSTVLFAGVEQYVKPVVTYPMSSNNYFDVTDFTISSVGEITDEMLDKLDRGEITTQQIVEQILSNVISFSYQPIEKRIGTLYSSQPYVGAGEFKDYNINSFNVDDCLQNLMDTEGKGVVHIFTKEEAEDSVFTFMSKYGGIAFCINYIANISRGTDYEVTEYSPQRIWISKLSSEGTYYVYNEDLRMVVEVDRSHLEYLEWTDIDWIEKDVFSGYSIAYLQKMTVTVPGYASYAGLSTEQIVLQFNNSASVEGWMPSSSQTIPPTDKMTVHANGEPANIDQVKNYYRMLLYSSLGGMVSEAECSKEQQDAFRAGTVAPVLEIRLVYTENVDGSGEIKTRTVRFYDYGNDMKYFVTVNGVGAYWMDSARTTKMIRDLGYVFTGDKIVPEGVL